jgi:predicted double-glycine peptidase
MQIVLAFIVAVALASNVFPIKETQNNNIMLSMMDVNGNQVRLKQYVKPAKEIDNENIVHQTFDYSCGSAALATLLKYRFGEDLTERQVIQGLMAYGDSEQITKRRAFSLLDMKKFVGVLGYKGVGYKADIEDLKTIDGPFVVPIKILDYRHFIVFKGIYKDHVFIADPWRGNISFTMKEFKEAWYENIVFVIYPEGARTMDILSLKDKDLRYIDEDTALEFMRDRTPYFRIPIEQTMSRMYITPTVSVPTSTRGLQ